MMFVLTNLELWRKAAKSRLVIVKTLCGFASLREIFFKPQAVSLTLAAIGLIPAFCSAACRGEEFPQALNSQSIDRLHRLSPRFYSGAQPEGEAAFRELKQLGVRTILSVDGTKPDVAAARKQGLRYVHLPIGYDGIAPERLLQIVKAAQTLDGPIFVHCHHGRHRGPAAAAICCRAVEKWDSKTALAWLQEAETSPKYAGLFRDVRQFRMPTKADLAKVPADFPETTRLSTTVESMVAIDGCWDRLKALQKHGFRPLPDHPDVVPDQEALQLAEQFRELVRNDHSKKRGSDFLQRLSATSNAAMTLHERLGELRTKRSDERVEQSTKLMRQLEKSCAQCHAAFRDNK